MSITDYIPMLPAVPATFTLAELTEHLNRRQVFRHAYRLRQPVASICIKIMEARSFLAPNQPAHLMKRKNRNI